MLNTAPRPSSTVYSSGQTPEDITGLFNLAILSGLNLSQLPTPPVLTDPNYVPPSHNQDLLNGFTIATTTLATAMVSIRTYVRTKQCGGRYSMDDYCLVAGYFMLLSNWILVLVGVNNYQWGYHTYDMKLSSLLFDYKLLFVYEVTFTWSLVMIRLSLLFFLGRLFREASRSFTILNTALIVCNIIFGICSTLAYTFQCSKVRAAWDIYVKFETGCKPLYIYYIISACQLALDFASVMAPVRLVHALVGLSFKKKVEVLAMFSLGLSACVISIARCFYLAPVVESLDQADASVNITICCQLEGTVALVAACVPAARQFFGSLSNEPKVVRVTDRVVKSLRSFTTSATSSSASKCDSVTLSRSSQSRSQIDRGVGGTGVAGDRDSRLLHSHYGRITGAGDSMEMVAGTGMGMVEEENRDLRGKAYRDGDVEASAAAAGLREMDAANEERKAEAKAKWVRHLSIPRLKFNHQISRYSSSPSPTSSHAGLRGTCTRPTTPPTLIPMLRVHQEARPGLPTNRSFDSTNYPGSTGVNSSTNSLDLSHWDTVDSIQVPAALAPRPSSSGRSGNLHDWRDNLPIDRC